MNTGRILIINPFGIGDVLFATPLIRHLRKQFPDSFIGFICNSRVAPLLAANKNLDEVFVFDKGDYRALWHRSKTDCIRQFFGFLKSIGSKKFDIAIDLSLGHQYSFFLMLLGIPARVGYNFRNRGRFLTHKIDIAGYHDKHIVEYYLDLCAEIASPLTHSLSPEGRGIKGEGVCNDDNRDLEIFIPQEDLDWADNFLKNNGVAANQRLFAVIPGGGASWGETAIYKHWPVENFAKVADELVDRYKVKIILFGSHEEIDICEAVSRTMHNKPIFACGKTGLLQFAALLKKCNLAICNDGGPLHIAAGVGAKTVSIFGPVDENVYGPYPPSPRHIVMKQSIDCRPCYKGFKFNQCQNRLCLLNIRPQDVVRAAEKLLS